MTVSAVVRGDNATLIAEVAKLWIGPDDIVLDPTYGRGLWWTRYRPDRLIVHDLALDGVDFRQLPEEDASVDVVAFDPPYVATGGRCTSTIPSSTSGTAWSTRQPRRLSCASWSAVA